MTGQPAHRTTEMKFNGGNIASYLARTLLVCLCLGLEAKGLSDFQGRRGITSVVRWHLRLVIFGVDSSRLQVDCQARPKIDSKNYLKSTPCEVVEESELGWWATVEQKCRYSTLSGSAAATL